MSWFSRLVHKFDHVLKHLGAIAADLGSTMLGMPPGAGFGVAELIMHAHAGNKHARARLKVMEQDPKKKAYLNELDRRLREHPDFATFKEEARAHTDQPDAGADPSPNGPPPPACFAPPPPGHPAHRHRGIHIPGAAHWIQNAVKTAGRPLGSATHFISKETGALSHLVGKVPFAGPLFSGIVDVTLGGPWHMSDDIIHGVRLDKAISRELKRQLKDFKEIGPYAQMVFSLVPGFGPFVAGAIGAGLALANGQPISQVLLAGVTGMCPGGPLAHMAMQAGAKAVSMATSPGGFKNFKNLSSLADIGVAALPIPAEAQKCVDAGIHIVCNLASGERLDQALIDGAMTALPLDSMPAAARSAILAAGQTIKAVAKGERIDHALIENGLHALPIDSLPVPDSIKKAIQSVADAGGKIANGQHVDKVLFAAALSTAQGAAPGVLPANTLAAMAHVNMIVDGANKQAAAAAQIVDISQQYLVHQGLVPKAFSNALKSGVAMGHGQGLQAITAAAVATGQPLTALAAEGLTISSADPVVGAARKAIPAECQVGFDVGIGVSRKETGIDQFMTVRAALAVEAKRGFDMAISLHTGRVTNDKAQAPNATAAAGQYMTLGMRGACGPQKTGMLSTISVNPELKMGADVAIAKLEKWREPWWEKLLEWIGFRPHHSPRTA